MEGSLSSSSTSSPFTTAPTGLITSWQTREQSSAERSRASSVIMKGSRKASGGDAPPPWLVSFSQGRGYPALPRLKSRAGVDTVAVNPDMCAMSPDTRQPDEIAERLAAIAVEAG